MPRQPAILVVPGAPAPEPLPSAARLLALAIALVAVCASAGLVASEVEKPIALDGSASAQTRAPAEMQTHALSVVSTALEALGGVTLGGVTVATGSR